MVKVIINADDCGISKHVDNEIRRFMEAGLISSTTVMANMHDFEGACQLYRDHHEHISFGIHFNLTEGSPLVYSQLLLDKGYYVERNGEIQFYGKEYDYRQLTHEMVGAIKVELECQAHKILDAGILASHIDSHHHVHFHRQLISVFCQVAKDFQLTRMRRNDNTHKGAVNHVKTSLWRILLRHYNSTVRTTDYFCGMSRFLEMINTNDYHPNKIYEIMCHPGHAGVQYVKENEQIEKRIVELKVQSIKMVRYDEL